MKDMHIHEKNSEISKGIERLREKAEKKISARTKKRLKELSPGEAERIIHELKVHQIELEMQNEELRRAHVELEKSRSRYSDLYDFAPVGYFTLDEKGLILEANLTGAGLLGIERALLIKKPFNVFILKDYKDEFYLHHRKVFDTSERQNCEIKLRNKKGAEFYAQMESILFIDSKGRKTCRTSVIDATERKQLQAQLIQTEKLSAMGLMAGALAHELNSPLGGIIPLIERYKNEAEENAERRRELLIIKNACDHMAKIIRDFNSFSRKSEVELHRLEVNKVIEDTLSFGAIILKKNGILIIKKYKNDLPFVLCDKTELQQVVMNMITNAGDAMSEGGTFVIKTGVTRDNKSVIMEFDDNGVGIEKENLVKIFEPFFTTKGRGKGTGLGLSVSQEIVHKHGGDIRVKSKPGKGSSFIIYLPAVKSNTT